MSGERAQPSAYAGLNGIAVPMLSPMTRSRRSRRRRRRRQPSLPPRPSPAPRGGGSIGRGGSDPGEPFTIWTWLTVFAWLLVLASSITAGSIHFRDWKSQTFIPPASFGLVVSKGTDLSKIYFPANDPSLDIDVNSPGQIDGVFRVNAIVIPQQRVSPRIGLVLPRSARVIFAGASGQMSTLQDASNAYKGQGLACQPWAGKHAPIYPPKGVFFIGDSASNKYSLDCHASYEIAWITLPSKRESSAAQVPGEQAFVTDSSAQIGFTLRDNTGLSRQAFSAWSGYFTLQTAPGDTSVPEIEAFSDAFQKARSAPTLSFSICGVSGSLSPYNYTESTREYFLNHTFPMRDGPCPTWAMPVDGSSHDFAGNFTDDKRSFWEEFATGASLLLLGTLLGSFLTHPREVLRPLRRVGRLRPRRRRS